MQDRLTRGRIRQSRLKPQLHAAGAKHRRRNAAHFHGGHHHANPLRAGALQPVEHGQQVPVEALAAVLEDQVRVIDEDDGRSVSLCALKNIAERIVKVAGIRDNGSIDQEELSLQSMGQCAADGGLAGARRSGPQNSAPGSTVQNLLTREIPSRRKMRSRYSLTRIIALDISHFGGGRKGV